MAHKPFVRTLRAQWLGAELRRLREERHMTLDQVAQHLRRDSSALGRYERAEWPIGRTDVHALLDLYGFHEAEDRDRMLRLAEEVWRTDRWSENYSDILVASFIDFPWLESRAQRICIYHTMLIPGLFQTREYAEVVIRRAERGLMTEPKIQRAVDMRMDRQKLLRSPGASEIDAVVDVSVLRRRIGGTAVTREQLRRLAECVALPHVSIRILPDSVDLHGAMEGSFWLFEMPSPYPAVAHLEYLGGHIYLESPKSDRYVHAYDDLWKAALSPRESAELIESLMEDLT